MSARKKTSATAAFSSSSPAPAAKQAPTAPGTPAALVDKYMAHSYRELNVLLKRLNLPSSGSKSDLCKRLANHEATTGVIAADVNDDEDQEGGDYDGGDDDANEEGGEEDEKNEGDDFDFESDPVLAAKYTEYQKTKWIAIQKDFGDRGLVRPKYITKDTMIKMLLTDDIKKGLSSGPSTPKSATVFDASSKKGPFQFSPSEWKAKTSPPKKSPSKTPVATPIKANGSALATTSSVSSTALASSDSLKELKEAHAEELDQLVLWKAPIKTTVNFVEWVAEYVIHTRGWLATRLEIVAAVFAIVAVLYASYQNDSIKPYIDLGLSLISWYGTWMMLGIASSVGIGFGGHTFILFLGPYITKTIVFGASCSNFTVDGNSEWLTKSFDFTCNTGGEADLYYLLSKVWLEAFCWGFGTAVGELSSYFFARGARLAGEQLEDHEDLEELSKTADREGMQSLSYTQKAKVICFRLLRHTRFFGILLLASVPNPLFDLAGIFAGYMLIPFWTFFGATVLGKAVFKVTLQTAVVVGMVYDNDNAPVMRLLQWLKVNVPAVGEFLLQQMQKQLKEYRGEKEPTVPSFLSPFEILLLVVLFVCVVSIINSLAQVHLAKKHRQAKQELIQAISDQQTAL